MAVFYVVFMKHKSPGASLSEDDFYKSMCYCALYKTSEKRVGAIDADEISLTLVREKRPAALMAHLKKRGAKIASTAPGVYNVSGTPCMFATQIVAYGEMDEKSGLWLRALTKEMTQKTYREFADAIYSEDSSGDRQIIDAAESLVYVARQGNKKLFVQEEGDEMIRGLNRTIDKMVDDARAKGEQIGIAKGEQIGIAKGEQIGIAKGTVEVCREIGESETNIIARLIKKLGISRDEAERFLAEFS